MKIDAETLKKQVILHLPYLLFLLVFAKLGEAVRLAPGADASQKLLGLSEGFALAFQNMWPGAAMDWLIGLCGAAIMRLAVYLRLSGFFDPDLCRHLCSAGPVYPIVRRRARCDLGNGGLYGTAGFCPV